MIDPTQPIEIPRTVDEPLHMLLWTVDDVAPVGLGLFAGVLVGKMMFFFLLGIIGSYFYRRIRDGNPDGLFLHLLYWIGLLPSKARTVPNPYVRLFLT
ncbi:type IV conjugative transfer system protein TraL [Azospirillum sp. sgz302134]